MLTHFDFNRLKIFYFIYMNNSVVGAAGSLNITRSAVSQHLKKFEEEIDTRLFTRLHKSLVPTAEAHQLFEMIAPFFRELETGLRSIRQRKLEPAGILRIGAPVEFGKTYFPRIIGAFREQYKRVTFSLILGDPEKLISQVRTGELDFALVDLFLTERYSLNDSAIYAISPVIDEEVILMCSRKYCSNTLHNDFSLRNLLAMDYIAYQQNTLALKTWFRHHYQKTVISPNIVLTVDSVRAVVSAAENHIGLGIVPSHVVYDQIHEGTIVPIPSPKKDIINSISLLQLQDKVPTLAEKKFQDFFRQMVIQDKTLRKFSAA